MVSYILSWRSCPLIALREIIPLSQLWLASLGQGVQVGIGDQLLDFQHLSYHGCSKVGNFMKAARSNAGISRCFHLVFELMRISQGKDGSMNTDGLGYSLRSLDGSYPVPSVFAEQLGIRLDPRTVGDGRLASSIKGKNYCERTKGRVDIPLTVELQHSKLLLQRPCMMFEEPSRSMVVLSEYRRYNAGAYGVLGEHVTWPVEKPSPKRGGQAGFVVVAVVTKRKEEKRCKTRQNFEPCCSSWDVDEDGKNNVVCLDGMTFQACALGSILVVAMFYGVKKGDETRDLMAWMPGSMGLHFGLHVKDLVSHGQLILPVTYTSVHSEARSWSIPSEDPYEEAARQLLEQAPRSPEYVPEDHVPVYILEPEHPEDLVPAEDEAPTPPLPPFFLSPHHIILHYRVVATLPSSSPPPENVTMTTVVKGVSVESISQKRSIMIARLAGMLTTREVGSIKSVYNIFLTISTLSERQAENKRKLNNTSKNNQNQQQPNKRQNTGKTYAARHGEKKYYGGSKPLCPKCNYHNDGPCAPKCHRCNIVGYLVHNCRRPTNDNTTNDQRGTGTSQKVNCYECGNQWHYRRDFPERKNQSLKYGWVGKIPSHYCCDGNIIRVSFGNKTLIIRNDEGNRANESQLNTISCTKYMQKGFPIFLAYVTAAKVEDKSEKKRLEDVPIVRDFPEVIPEDLPGLPPTRQVEISNQSGTWCCTRSTGSLSIGISRNERVVRAIERVV
ncbi:hypothetical protein Tco_1338620 [Tanacetum coccineum]